MNLATELNHQGITKWSERFKAIAKEKDMHSEILARLFENGIINTISEFLKHRKTKKIIIDSRWGQTNIGLSIILLFD